MATLQERYTEEFGQALPDLKEGEQWLIAAPIRKLEEVVIFTDRQELEDFLNKRTVVKLIATTQEDLKADLDQEVLSTYWTRKLDLDQYQAFEQERQNNHFKAYLWIPPTPKPESLLTKKDKTMPTTFMEELAAFKLEIADYNSKDKTEALMQWGADHTVQFQQEMKERYPIKDIFLTPGNSAKVLRVNMTLTAIGGVPTLEEPNSTYKTNIEFFVYEDQFQQATTEDLINLSMFTFFTYKVRSNTWLLFTVKEWRISNMTTAAWTKEQFPFSYN